MYFYKTDSGIISSPTEGKYTVTVVPFSDSLPIKPAPLLFSAMPFTTANPFPAPLPTALIINHSPEDWAFYNVLKNSRSTSANIAESQYLGYGFS